MNLDKVKFSANNIDNPNLENAEIVANLLKLGDKFGKNVSISAPTSAERQEKLRAVLYGTKNPSQRHD